MLNDKNDFLQALTDTIDDLQSIVFTLRLIRMQMREGDDGE